jgi:hypothetical protein
MVLQTTAVRSSVRSDNSHCSACYHCCALVFADKGTLFTDTDTLQTRYLQLAGCLARGRHWESALELLAQVPALTGVAVPSFAVYAAAIDACAKGGQSSLAIQLQDAM